MQQSGSRGGRRANEDITTIYYLIIYAAKFSFTGRRLGAPNANAETTVKTLKCTPTHTPGDSENPSNKR